jgi:hypothetical protein
MKPAQNAACSGWESDCRRVTQIKVRQQWSLALRICAYPGPSVVLSCQDTGKRNALRTVPLLSLVSLLVALTGTIVAGCKSADQPASGSFASVSIQGHKPEQIRAAAALVFQQEGYTATDVRHPEMIFEKPDSQWERIAQGSWVDERPFMVRVRVSVVPVADGVFEIRCQAFSVRRKIDASIEQEVRLKKNRSQPYQALLNKVSERLGR